MKQYVLLPKKKASETNVIRYTEKVSVLLVMKVMIKKFPLYTFITVLVLLKWWRVMLVWIHIAHFKFLSISNSKSHIYKTHTFPISQRQSNTFCHWLTEDSSSSLLFFWINLTFKTKISGVNIIHCLIAFLVFWVLFTLICLGFVCMWESQKINFYNCLLCKIG